MPAPKDEKDLKLPTDDKPGEDDDGPASPLDTASYTPELKAADIPPFKRSKDRTKSIEGYGAGEAAAHRELLSDLSQGDQIRLLEANNIRPLPASGTDTGDLWEMAAFVVSGNLQPASNSAVRFRVLKMLTPDKGRTDSVGYSYKEFESHLQRQTVATSNVGFGIPGIFRVDASYSDTSAVATHDRTVKIFFQASQLIPKAKIVINEKDISLDPDFVSKVQDISKTGTKQQKTNALLALLRDYGHFVPLSMMLGGRITLHTSRELSDKSQFEKVEREFKAAADARFTVDGVPVEAGGGLGVGTGQTNTTNTTQQAKSLLMELQGGDENLASSKAGELGTKWIASLGRYREWRIVGFYENSLVPIIAFLPQALRETCTVLLRDYFVSKLGITESNSAGDRHGKDLVKDSGAPDFHKVKRITDIEVQHGGCLDRLKVSYEVYADGGKTTEKVVTKWVGSDAGTRAHIKLRDDEEITAIEAWVKPEEKKEGLVQQVAFKTNTGRRFPNVTGFYGENRGRKTDVFKTIEAPRVRGIIGSNGAYIHRIGLAYAALDTNAKSREYLLAMEPFLFPEGDYGIIPT